MSNPAVTFTSAIPMGNACLIGIETDAPCPRIHFTPSPKGGPEAMWFYFTLERGEGCAANEFECVMHLGGNLLIGQDATSPRFNPVVKTERNDWLRVEQVTIVKLPDGSPLASWKVPAGEGRVEIALTYPYGRQELDSLKHDCKDTFSSQAVSCSMGERIIERLANGFLAEGEEPSKPGIYCLARQHSGETPGSWALDGFLRAIAGMGHDAPRVWAIPLVDIDGVEEGMFGKDRFPWDMNRSWASRFVPEELWKVHGTHAMRHEIRSIQRDMLRWTKHCLPRLVLDFHSPVLNQSKGVFCYLRLGPDKQMDDRHRPFVEVMEKTLGSEYASPKFFQNSSKPSRYKGTRIVDFVNDALGCPAITLEVPYTRSTQLVFDREHYREAGARIAKGVVSLISG